MGHELMFVRLGVPSNEEIFEASAEILKIHPKDSIIKILFAGYVIIQRFLKFWRPTIQVHVREISWKFGLHSPLNLLLPFHL
jgi:hypothetical protein